MPAITFGFGFVATGAGTVAQPSKNLCVWNRSIRGNLLFDENSIICTQCWLSYSQVLQHWARRSESADCFHRPLSTAIRNLPLPPAKDFRWGGAVYSQEIADERVTESVSFWCRNSADLISGFRAYARKHNLSMSVEKGQDPKEIWVLIETKEFTREPKSNN